MKFKNLTKVLFVINFMFIPILACAQSGEWISYAHTKTILPDKGINNKKYDSAKFKFEGNCIYEESVNSAGMNWTEYGVYQGMSNGNKVYNARQKGYNTLRGSYDQPFEIKYYLVSTDNSIINIIFNDNRGEPSIIEVYEKANTEKSKKLYR